MTAEDDKMLAMMGATEKDWHPTQDHDLAEDADEATFTLSKIDFVTDMEQMFTQAQMDLISGYVDPDTVMIREAGGGTWIPYLPIDVYENYLDKLTLFNWTFDVDEHREIIDERLGSREVFVSGFLVLATKEGEKRIRSYGSFMVKGSGNSPTGNAYNSAVSIAERKAAKRLGIGRCLGDPAFFDAVMKKNGCEQGSDGKWRKKR